jgi:hypothetical protein
MTVTRAQPTESPTVTEQSRYSRLAQLMLAQDVRHEMIARAAYFRAERRGFEPGHELEDWLAAETEVDTGVTLGVPFM